MIWWQIAGTLLRENTQVHVPVADWGADDSRSETPEMCITGRQLEAALCSPSALPELDLLFLYQMV